MELRWTETAAADLERISNYLFEQTPEKRQKQFDGFRVFLLSF